MTLDEAIKHAEEQADKLGCSQCGEEHRQLAEWLKELRQRRQFEAERQRLINNIFNYGK